MAEPIAQIFTDLGKLRAQVLAELLKLPAPGPARKALESLDRELGRAEAEMTKVVSTISPTTMVREVNLP
ncbi:hypothetical protein LCGC14_1649160, partial [marine sediment metagenome]